MKENLNDLLKLVKKIRLLFPDKKIWMWTGFKWEDIFSVQSILNKNKIENIDTEGDITLSGTALELTHLRQQIVSQCDVLVDGQYIDSKRDITLKWRGSSNQRVIDIQKSLQQNQVVLYCE